MKIKLTEDVLCNLLLRGLHVGKDYPKIKAEFVSMGILGGMELDRFIDLILSTARWYTVCPQAIVTRTINGMESIFGTLTCLSLNVSGICNCSSCYKSKYARTRIEQFLRVIGKVYSDEENNKKVKFLKNKKIGLTDL